MAYWVAGTLGASALSGLGSYFAGNTQAKGQQQASQMMTGEANTLLGQEQPFMQGGYGAMTQLNELLGTAPGNPANGAPNGYLTQSFDPTQAQLNEYPGYQFALQTGGQAVRNADTPGVGALSGPALKDLTNFNVGTANQFYNQYFNQFQQQQNNIFSRLSQIAGLGQGAAGQLGNAEAGLYSGAAQATAGAAGSQAAGQMGIANALGGGINTIASMSFLKGL